MADTTSWVNEPAGLGWLEPESAANEDNQPKYPYNKITQSESGHSLELDDTPNRERVKLLHRTGTFIEMHPNGNEVHKVYGDGFEITIRNKNVLIGGDCRVTVEGNASFHVKGDRTERVDGNFYQVVNGNYSLQVKGNASLASDKPFKLTSSPLLGGYLDLNTGGDLHLKGDLVVEGTLRAGDIFSETRVDAVLGMSAGPAGFVTVMGGVSVGIPVAAPGNITCIGLVNAGVAVNAPLGDYMVSDSIWSFDVINMLLHNFHIHPTPKGPSGSPIPKQVS